MRARSRAIVIAATLLTGLGVVPALASPAPAAVPKQPAECCAATGADVPKVGGDFGDQDYSSLDQITTGNVGRLAGAWLDHLENGAAATRQEATPVAVGGVLYVQTGQGDVFAVNGATGKVAWEYKSGFAGTERGVAVSGRPGVRGARRRARGRPEPEDRRADLAGPGRHSRPGHRGQRRGHPVDAVFPRPGPGRHRERRRGRHARPPVRAAGQHRRRGLELRGHGRAGPARAQYLEGQLVEAGRRGRVDGPGRRPAARPDLPGRGQPRAEGGRRGQGRERPVHQLAGRAAREHRQAGLVLPVRAPRPVGLRRHYVAGHRRCPLPRGRAQGRHLRQQDRLAVLPERADRQARRRSAREEGAGPGQPGHLGHAAHPAGRLAGAHVPID